MVCLTCLKNVQCSATVAAMFVFPRTLSDRAKAYQAQVLALCFMHKIFPIFVILSFSSFFPEMSHDFFFSEKSRDIMLAR
jgi:hypothetical protein